VFSGMLCQMLMEGFFMMASKYMPELSEVMHLVKAKKLKNVF
jgi:hypothetical protein